MDGLPLARLTAIGMTSGELQKLERLYTLAQPMERAAMREFFASKVEQDLSEWLGVQREVGHFTVPPSAGPITEDEQAMLDLISAFIPMSQKGVAGGVASLNAEGELEGDQVPLSVVSSSLVNLRAADFATVAGGQIIDFAALVKAMEETGKGAVIPFACEAKEPNVLCNKQNITGAVAKAAFQYRFYGMGPRAAIKCAVTGEQAIFRFNQNAEGVKESETLYGHPDAIFEGILAESTGAGTFATAFNRTFRIVNVQLKNIANGFVNKGFADNTFIENFSGDRSVTGWGWQGENGDGQRISNVQFYASKGVFAKHGSGTATGLVSGEHRFVVGKWTIADDHLEGDGPITEAGGKAQNALIKLEGGVYVIRDCRLFTLTNPSRPCVEVNDSGGSERSTQVTFDNTQFIQRLNNPANPEGVAEPIGNLQGVAVRLQEVSTKSVFRFINGTQGECYQQTAEESRFDERPVIGFQVTASDAGLQTLLTARSVMLSSMNSEVHYNVATASWEARPVGRASDQVTTHRFGQPALSVAKYAIGSAEAKAAPTTRKAGTHYYVIWAIDERGRKTNLSTEHNTTLTEGEVPVLNIQTGYPCRVVIAHGTSAGVFTEWAEVILPLGQGVLPDMGNAIAGQEWLTSGMPVKPTTATSENNTADGYVSLTASAHAVSFVTSIFQSGEWQKEGDILYLNGIPGRCIASAASNNGGTWILLAQYAGADDLAEGESTMSRDKAISAVTMTSELLRLSFRTAMKTQTRKHLRVNTNSTAAGATPSLIELAVFSVNAEGELTRIAKTANNTALLAAAGTPYEQATEAPWEKVAGQRYAYGLLVVTAATAPTVYGVTALASTEMALAPRLTAIVAAQKTIPASIPAASLANSSSGIYVADAA
jgi:hypothetical protein